MTSFYLKARWLGSRWILIVNCLLLSIVTFYSALDPDENQLMLYDMEDSDEAPVRSKVEEDAVSYGLGVTELIELNNAISEDVRAIRTENARAFPYSDSLTYNRFGLERNVWTLDRTFSRAINTPGK